MFSGVLQKCRFPDTRLPADHQSGATREPCCVQKLSQGGTVRLPAVQHPNNLSAPRSRALSCKRGKGSLVDWAALTPAGNSTVDLTDAAGSGVEPVCASKAHIRKVPTMFKTLTDTSKAAIFTGLVLILAVAAALAIKALGLTSLLWAVVWSSTPAMATVIMLLVVTRD